MSDYSEIDGSIITDSKVEIIKIEFKTIQGYTDKYCLEVTFKDINYKRTQNAVNAPSGSYSFSSNRPFKHQKLTQLPSYIFRLFKKQDPPTNTSFITDFSNVGLEFLWKPVNSFNDQTYLNNNNTEISFKNFGVGLVPFFYMFRTNSWSYNSLNIFDYTDNGIVRIRFDANGGAEYFAINSSGYNYNIFSEPYKQVAWNGEVDNNTNAILFKKCNTYNPANGFTEPGGYLLTVLRNAIDNYPVSYGGTRYEIVTISTVEGLSKSRTLLSGALTCIKPPTFSLTQSNNPIISDISCNVHSYGSVNIINNKWVLSNIYGGFPNFNTPKFTYYPVDASKPNGLFDLSGIYTTSIPPNKRDAFDNITIIVDKNIVQSIEESYEYFNIRAAFRYDFRLWDNSATIFNPFSYSSNTYNTGYVNFDLNENIIPTSDGRTNNLFFEFEPDFNKNWIDNIEPLNESEIWIRDNNDYFITPYVFSNFITIPPSTSIPIPFTTTIHKLNEQYYFKTAWTEIFPRLLRKNILKSEYTLRLYKHNKSKKTILYDYNSDNSNNLLPVPNYKFTDISNSGLHIDLSSTYFDVNNITFISANKYSKDVAIYTDKSGNQLVDTDFKDLNVNVDVSFNGWTEDEILGGWLAVLQRNFTKDGTNIINVVNQGYFFSHFPATPTLTINRESTDKMPISLTTTPFNQYTYANHFWSKKDVDAVNSNIVISDLSYDLSFNSSPSITDIRSIYNNHEHHELLNRVVLDMGRDLSDNKLVYFYEQFDYDDELLYNLTRIGGVTGFENLYYEAQSNIVDLYEKREALQTQLNTEIVNFEQSNKFVFKTTWDERYFNFLTNKLLGSKYTLRLYKRIAGYKEINDNAYMGISGDNLDGTITDTSKLLQLTDISNDGPVANYKFISDIKTGLDVSDNWYQIPSGSSIIPITDASSTIVANSRKMDIITDRVGNVYYRDASGLYYKNGVQSLSTLLSATTLSGNEWTENDIMGGWLMVLQRNFSTTDLPSVINVTNQACFAKYIPKPTDTGNLRLTLSIVDGSYNLPKNFVTSPTNIYKHAVNKWGAKKIYVGDGTTVTDISSAMNYIPDPTMYDLAGNYSYTQGPSKLFNNVYIDFGVGTGRTKFKEKLLGSSIPYLQSHEIIDLCGIDQTIYDFSTNEVTIYESIQTNDPVDSLTNMQCNYAFYDNSGRVYFDLLFDDPNKTILLDNANNAHKMSNVITHINGQEFIYTPSAYDVNIFKKVKGNGTDARSQWDTALSIVDTSFVYIDKLNRGRKITKSELSTSPLNSTSYKIAIDACSNYISYANANKSDLLVNTKYAELSGSFETGGYLVAIRRNFLKTYNFANFGSMLRNVTIECFTLNTQYVCVPPTQSSINYSKNVFGSGLLTLDFSANANPANEYYSLTTPFYNSYDASGNVDIGITFYARTEGDKDQPVYEVPLLGSSLPINVGDTTKTYKITKNSIINKYPNLGSVSMFIDLSYNWFSATPVLDSFPIGKIGGDFAGVTSATRDLTFYNPRKVAGDQLYPNQATSTINRIIIPANNSYVNSKKQNVTINSAEFSVKNGKRHLAINIQEDPSTIVDLCSNWGIHQYPYALRLYKKRKEGATANDQWFDISGGYKGYGNFTFNNIANITDSSNNEGIGIESRFIDAEGKKIMNLFIGSDGLVFYNDYPADDVLLVPFEDDDAGAYLVVIQRHFTFKTYTNDVKPDLMISTKGRYLSFIPDGIYNPFQLDTSQNVVYTQRSTPNAYGMYYDQEIVTNVVSNANPYSAYKPGNQNIEDITYSWTFKLPNIVGGKTRPFTGTTGSSINLDQFVEKYGGLDKEVVLETVAKYNFGIANNQLYEHYPLLSDAIEGPNIAEYSSTSYSRSLCIQRESFPPPPWARYTIDCSENMTPERREELQMRRKAETLKHTSNLVQKERTKSEYLSFVMRGFNQRKQTYATQTANYTNPNTKEFSIVGGRTIALPSACQQKVLSFPTYCSDVPGRVMNLTYDPSVPLVNYKTVRTYVNSTTETYEDKK